MLRALTSFRFVQLCDVVTYRLESPGVSGLGAAFGTCLWPAACAPEVLEVRYCVTYSSREAYEGRQEDTVDARSDVYSLSLVVFELAVKQLPFPGISDLAPVLY